MKTSSKEKFTRNQGDRLTFNRQRWVDERDYKEVTASLKELLKTHSMESIGIDSSMRRIQAKKRARALLRKLGEGS